LISKLHPRLAQVDVVHVTRVETPEEAVGESQLPLI
jgi:hypothetical protein